MSSENHNSSNGRDEEILRAAADWIVRRDLGFASEDEREFNAWLDEDPRHGEAFEGRLRIWKQFDQVKPKAPAVSSEPSAGESKGSVPKGRRVVQFAVWGGIAAAIAIGFFVTQTIQNPGHAALTADHVAMEYERHKLDDESVVELNAGARVSVHYSGKERLIRLHAGEAHFIVMKDSSRPFIVEAGETRIKALGTAFNVNFNAESVEVLVTEGSVWLDSQALVDQEAGEESFVLSAGQRSVVSHEVSEEETVIEDVTAREVEEHTYWQSPNIEFIDQPLSHVVEQMNRYNEVQIVIADSEIATRSVTLSVRPKNIGGFLAMVEAAFDVKAETQSSEEIYLRAQ